MGQLLFVEVQNGCSKLSAQVLKGGKYWRICTDATRKKKKKLTEEHDQSRCWVPVPQRSHADLHRLKCSPSLLPCPASSKDQEPCIMQERFSSCTMICTGPNSTDTQGRPWSGARVGSGLQMSISSPISYSVSPSYHRVAAVTVWGQLWHHSLSAQTAAVKVQRFDAKHNGMHQVRAVQV